MKVGNLKFYIFLFVLLCKKLFSLKFSSHWEEKMIKSANYVLFKNINTDSENSKNYKENLEYKSEFDHRIYKNSKHMIKYYLILVIK